MYMYVSTVFGCYILFNGYKSALECYTIQHDNVCNDFNNLNETQIIYMHLL